MQELKAREEDLNRALMDQQAQEQELRRRERELLVREFELVEREIQLLMLQQATSSKPAIRKRTGLVRRKLLDKYRNGGAPQYISNPSGTNLLDLINAEMTIKNVKKVKKNVEKINKKRL